jgi:hypothetical protein
MPWFWYLQKQIHNKDSNASGLFGRWPQETLVVRWWGKCEGSHNCMDSKTSYHCGTLESSPTRTLGIVLSTFNYPT